jgi:hypothetical protein
MQKTDNRCSRKQCTEESVTDILTSRYLERSCRHYGRFEVKGKAIHATGREGP